jgi:hypothetical protein
MPPYMQVWQNSVSHASSQGATGPGLLHVMLQKVVSLRSRWLHVDAVVVLLAEVVVTVVDEMEVVEEKDVVSVLPVVEEDSVLVDFVTVEVRVSVVVVFPRQMRHVVSHMRAAGHVGQNMVSQEQPSKWESMHSRLPLTINSQVSKQSSYIWQVVVDAVVVIEEVVSVLLISVRVVLVFDVVMVVVMLEPVVEDEVMLPVVTVMVVVFVESVPVVVVPVVGVEVTENVLVLVFVLQ